MVEPLPTPQPSITVSIVVPVFSGEAFFRELTGEVERLRQRWIEAGSLLAVSELIFVDTPPSTDRPSCSTKLPKRNHGSEWCICRGISARMLRPQLRRLGRDSGRGSPASAGGNSRHVAESRRHARGASSLSSYDTYFDIALSWFTQRVEVVRMNLKDRRYIDTGTSGYTFRTPAVACAQIADIQPVKGAEAGSAARILLRSYEHHRRHIVDPRQAGAGVVCAPRLGLHDGDDRDAGGGLLEYTSILVLRAHGKPLFFAIDRSSDAALARA